MNRRSFFRTSIEAAVGAVIATSFDMPMAQANQPMPPQAVEAGGYIRPYGHCVTLPPQEWMNNGDWVMQKTLELLQPDRWHSWGDWPENGVPNRIPMIFATRYFDHDRVRRRMQARSGEFWMNVNEPEMPNQCFESPEDIADLTCKLIDIGQRSSAKWQWGSPAVTLTTEHGGLAWLTEWVKIMRRKRGISMPFTWFIHPYTCNTVQRLHDSMDAWWNWYEIWGGKTPVVISEYCAEDASEDVQADVMFAVNKMLMDGDIQGEFWFAAYKSSVMEERKRSRIPWRHYSLCELNYSTQTVSLTPLGQYWKHLHQNKSVTTPPF